MENLRELGRTRLGLSVARQAEWAARRQSEVAPGKAVITVYDTAPRASDAFCAGAICLSAALKPSAAKASSVASRGRFALQADQLQVLEKLGETWSCVRTIHI